VTPYKSYGDREVSPLIIQIKKSENSYFGVILSWEGWYGFQEFEQFLGRLNRYEIEEVKI
jgi:CRISPR-associated protein Cmr1